MRKDNFPRILPTPRLISMAPDVLPGEDHALAEALPKLLGSPETVAVDLVSFACSASVLKELGVLTARKETRIVLRPPDGITRPEVHELLNRDVPGLKMRQVDIIKKVGERIHLKMLLLRRSNGKQYAVLGSSNYTRAGTADASYANAECSVLFETRPGDPGSPVKLFERLWADGTKDVAERDFIIRREEDQDEEGVTTELVLLKFQEEVFDELVSSFEKRGKQNGVLLSLPTGAGKTVVAVRFLLEHVLTGPAKHVRWLAPHEELLYQAEDTFKKCRPYYRFDDLGVHPYSEIKKPSVEYHVNFATLRGAYMDDGATFPDQYSVVVVDEAHYGTGRESAMLPALRESFAEAFFLGLTATPFRKLPRELGVLAKLFGSPIYESVEKIRKEKDARGRKVLAEVDRKEKATGFHIRIDEHKLKAELVAEKLNDSTLQHFDDRRVRNPAIAKAWKPSYGQTLVFAVNVKHANNLAKAFREQHPTAAIQVLHTGEVKRSVPSVVLPSWDNKFSSEDRRNIYHLFKKGDIQVLIAVRLYTMGVDFPKVDTLMMACPTLSPVLYAQMLGRGLRGPAFGGTETVRLIDFADQFDAHAELKDTFISYVRHLAGEKTMADKMNQIIAIKRAIQEVRASSAREQFRDRAGFYAVITPKGRIWVRGAYYQYTADIGSAIARGFAKGDFKYHHMARVYLLEDQDKRQEVEKILKQVVMGFFG